MSVFSLQALHDEIENDPMAIGYKEANKDWKGDQVIADLINDPANGDTIQRQFVEPQEIIEQIVIGDWRALAAEDHLYLSLLPSLSTISTIQDSTEVRVNLLNIFGPTTVTRANLINVVQRQGSRAEVLWGEGKVVSISEVAYASNL